MIQRKSVSGLLKARLKQFRAVALLGPRQCGKSTLARSLNPDTYFDLENPRDLGRLASPQMGLEDCRGLIVLDEVQRMPGIFPLLRHLIDNKPDQHYLLLGSASPDLIKFSSESLAGRISFIDMSGFSSDEIPQTRLNRLWLRGGFPPSFLAKSDELSFQWREDYIRTFLERDLPALGLRIPGSTMRRFWAMLSHYHGQVVNFSELGRSFGIADTTIRKYIEILEGAYMLRVLQPWHNNTSKRLVKRPKIYFRDSGLFHSFLSVITGKALTEHPKLGASWEGFAVETVWHSIGKAGNDAYFWATHASAEVDLFWMHDGKSYACEFKFTDAPTLTRSMSTAVEDLGLEKLWVLYPGDKKYNLNKRVKIIPLSQIPGRWDYGL